MAAEASAAAAVVATGFTFWQSKANFPKYIWRLGGNLTALQEKMNEVRMVCIDVHRLVTSAERQGWTRNSGADDWLTSVEALEEEVLAILKDGSDMRSSGCLCGLSPANCRKRYRLSVLAETKKNVLGERLTLGRSFRVREDVAHEPDRDDQILQRSLEALRRAHAELQNFYKDIIRRVKMEEDRHLVRTNEVTGWLERVALLLEKEVPEFLQQAQSNILGKAERVKTIMEKKITEGCRFSDFTFEPADMIFRERSLESLSHMKDKLRALFDKVNRQVSSQEEPHLERTPEVDNWLKSAEGLLRGGVEEILQREAIEKIRGKSIGGTSQPQSNNRSYHELSKEADHKKTILENELDKGRKFTDLTHTPPDPLMDEIPLRKPVGMDTSFEKVWQWVQDDNVRRIGLYGMGGVGKTTLLKIIHNQLLEVPRNYDMVACIVVSRPTNPEKIQKTIWKSLNIPDAEWNETDELKRAGKILRVMRNKRFVLFLDDIWEEIDLLSLGIPDRSHQVQDDNSKIIFTTRLEKVCGLMRSDKKEMVCCLPPDKALELFRHRVGEEAWSHPEIPELAETLVDECDCLPLALIAVGAAMFGRTDPEEWRRTIGVSRRDAATLDEMGKVISVLKVSYDALQDETHKKCFLYCAVFPEDYKFDLDQLIDIWTGEGFVESFGGIQERRDRGMEIIDNLRRACLLEDSTGRYGDKGVRMHDVLREMASWVASEEGKKRNKVIVQDGLRSFEASEVKVWKEAETVSLWNAKVAVKKWKDAERIPPVIPRCSHLSTLIIRRTELKAFPPGFFSSMPSLRVLDLSENYSLEVLPDDIGAAEDLQYLNLRETRIDNLPVSIVVGMAKLAVLLVNYGCTIPEGVLSRLTVFRGSFSEDQEFDRVNELIGRNGNGLESASLDLSTGASVQLILDTEKASQLQRCLRELLIGNVGSLLIPRGAASRMVHLRHLYLDQCSFASVRIEDGGYGLDEPIRGDGDGPPIPSEYTLQPWSLQENHDCFRSLREIDIFDCEELVDVTALIWYAPSLTHLSISRCRSMEELIACDVDDRLAGRIFSRLSRLSLSNVPKLKSICRRALPFPSLEVAVFICPGLKKLPFDSSSGSRGNPLRIEGDQTWWEGLEWDDKETERLFSHKFVAVKFPEELNYYTLDA